MAGEAAIGVVLKTPLQKILEPISERIGWVKSHNVAEYRAFVRGLEAARSYGVEHLRVCLDSQLIVDQMTGRSQVKSENLKPLYNQAVSLKHQFVHVEIAWVPRTANAEAHALASNLLRPLRGKRKSAPIARRQESRKVPLRELAPDELCAYLLARPTIPDCVWTDEPRLVPRELREAFVRRVLLGEVAPEPPAAEISLE
jgi:ribonuclease HI